MPDLDFVLDETARTRLIDRFGPVALAWCATLPELVEKYCLRWDLELDDAMSGGTSRVFTGRQHGGRAVVLKLTPDLSVAATEAVALRAWAATRHTPDLLDADTDDGVLLLEKIEPGDKLSDQSEPASITEIVGLLTCLRESAPPQGLDRLPTLAERLDFLFALIRRRANHPRVCPAVPLALTDRAHELARGLAASGDSDLVHGDLHPGNVLVGAPGRGLVAIDPRPCTGDRTFDAVDWALDRVTSTGQFADRIEQFHAALPDLDGDRLRQWCTATAVISSVQLLFAGRPLSGTTQFLLQLAHDA